MNETVEGDDAVILKLSFGIKTSATGQQWEVATEGVAVWRGGGSGRGSDGVECSFFLHVLYRYLAARHGAGSRKAAQNRTMSLYGNNRMQRHFLLSGFGRNVGHELHPAASLVNCG